MFYVVKILNPHGEIKKVVTGQELAQTHWKKFKAIEENKNMNSNTFQQVPVWVKKKLGPGEVDPLTDRG